MRTENGGMRFRFSPQRAQTSIAMAATEAGIKVSNHSCLTRLRPLQVTAFRYTATRPLPAATMERAVPVDCHGQCVSRG